jgi:hypothetical protein
MFRLFKKLGKLFMNDSPKEQTGSSHLLKKRATDVFINSVKESFLKLKDENKTRDGSIDKIKRRVNYHALCLKSQEKVLRNIEKQLKYLFESVEKASATAREVSPTLLPTSTTPNDTSATAPGSAPDSRFANLDSLTRLQQETLFTIASLMMKENAKWIAMKTLVNTVYPGKPYNTVRTTIFEYINILEELGFVKRTKYSNITYVSVTDKALKTLNEKESSRKIKLTKLTKTGA